MSKKSNLFYPKFVSALFVWCSNTEAFMIGQVMVIDKGHDGLDLNGVPLTSLQIDAPRLDHSAQSVAFPFSCFKQKLRRTPDHAVTLAGQGLLDGLGL